MPRFISILTVLICLPAFIGPAGAQQHNAPDGATYQLDDSAFRGDWDRANDLYRFRYAPPGTAGDPIPWSDAFTVGTDGYVMFSSGAAAAAPVHIDGEMIVGAQGLSCTATTEGALRYTNSTALWEFCDGSAWVDLASGSGAGVAASPDRGIQFNSGGSFAASSDLVFTSTGYLGIGTDTPGSPFTLVGSNRNNIMTVSGIPDASDPTDKLIGISLGLATSASTTPDHTGDIVAMEIDNTVNTNEGTTDSVYGIRNNISYFALSGGGITNAYNFYAKNPTIVSGGSITNAYGLYIENIDVATTDNYAIYAAGGDNYFGGNVGIGTDAPQTGLDVAGTLKIAYGGESCDTAREGAMLYDSAAGKFQVCADSGTGWENLTTGSGGTPPASPDRGIQFNSGGSFAASSGLVFTSTGMLQLGTLPTDGSLFSFFRAQTGGGNTKFWMTWDDDIGSGDDRIRLQVNDAYIGFRDDSSCCDPNTDLNLYASRRVQFDAGDKFLINVPSGATRDMVFTNIGGARDAAIIRVKKVSGSNDDGTMLLKTGNGGNQLFLDENGRVGLGTDTPQAKLDVAGEIRFSSTGLSCAAGTEGAMLYDSGTGKFQVCADSGTGWENLTTGSGGTPPASPDRGIQFNSAGSFTASSDFVFTGTGTLEITSSATGSSHQDLINLYNAGGGKMIELKDDGFGRPALNIFNPGTSGEFIQLNPWNQDQPSVHISATKSVDLTNDDNGSDWRPLPLLVRKKGDGTTGIGFSIGNFAQIVPSGIMAEKYGSQDEIGLHFVANRARRMTIRETGNIGIGTLSPATPLDVAGEIKFSSTGLSCAAGTEGAMLYDSAAGKFQVCADSGTGWENLTTGSGGTPPASPDRGIQFNSGGSFGASGDLVFTSTGRLGLGTATPANMFHIQADNFSDGRKTLLVERTDGASMTVLASKNNNESFDIEMTGSTVNFRYGPISGNNRAFIQLRRDTSWPDFGAPLTVGNDGVGVDKVSPAARLDVAGEIRFSSTGLSCAAGTEGAMLYDSAAGKFQVCADSGTGWENLTTGSGGTPPASPDRGIQFNSGGSFGAAANLTYTSTGDLIVGSYQINDTGTGNEDSRMFFHKGTGAFRAGSVGDDRWDIANLGQSSFAVVAGKATAEQAVAIGNGAVASDPRSIAIGRNSTASKSEAYAIGNVATASGGNSAAIGSQVTASGGVSFAFGRNVTASGTRSMALGIKAEAAAADSVALGVSQASGTTPLVSGSNSFGIFMDDQSGVNLASAGMMGVFGGSMVIDPADPATNLSADTALEVEGTLKIAYGGENCNTAREGAILYDSGTGKFQVCADSGTGWENLTTGSGGTPPASPNRGIQFNSGGSFGASGDLVYTSDGDLLLSGSHTGTASVPATGAGTRMFFDTEMSAFRAGNVGGSQWDNANIGQYSVAFGLDNKATKNGSAAFGAGSEATGSRSFAAGETVKAGNLGSTAFGEGSNASGYNAFAQGNWSKASGGMAVAMGRATDAGGGSAVALGQEVIASGGNSFAFGLGDMTSKPDVSGTSSFGIFMGDHNGITFASANTMGVFGGRMVIDPDVPADKLSAAVTLDVDGEIRAGHTGAACSGTTEGALRYNSSKQTLEVCDGTEWDLLVASSATGDPSTPSSDLGYIVLTSGSWTGDLEQEAIDAGLMASGDGVDGANALCLDDLQNNAWMGKTDAQNRSLLTDTNVKAFVCGPCQNALANVEYAFAVSGDDTKGGATFTADGDGLGPGNTQNWSGVNYFGGALTYWTNRGAGTASLWPDNSSSGVKESRCSGFTSSSSSQSGKIGNSNNSDSSRWQDTGKDCGQTNHLVCFVHP